MNHDLNHSKKIIDLLFFHIRFFKSLIYMNLTQIIVYKHQDEQSFVCFFNTKAQCTHTCVVVLSPDSKIFDFTLCVFELFRPLHGPVI